MSDQPESVERILGTINHWIIDRPRTVIVVFLLVTALFAGGLGAIEMDAGLNAFTDGIDAQNAQDQVNEEFEPPFEEDAPTTQLIHRGENVVSRDALLRMLEIQHHLEESEEHRVTESSSVAEGVARSIDPTADTREEQIRTLEGATDAQVRETVRELGENPEFAASLSEDFSPAEPEASATVAVVTHESDVDEQAIQYRVRSTVESMDGNIVTFGNGILDTEFENVISDSMAIIVPVVIVLILAFLITAYRDPFDVVLGLVSLVMAVIWTFGFTGHAGIPFSMVMIAIPPLLLAVGIDFGIHAVNRYREERVDGAGIEAGMDTAATQLLIAFFIVTGTTVIGFGANVTSDLAPIREFGFVASIGITFTFFIFGIFLPAAKVYLDQLRDAYGIREFGSSPLGSEDSLLGRALPVGAHVGRRAPIAMVLVALVVTAGTGAYATTVDTTFEEEDFLPAEELPGYAETMPEPLAPEEYTVTATINYLEDTFESGEDDEVTIYVEGPIHEDHALESVHRAGNDPPSTIVTEDGRAESNSIVDVMHDHAENDDEFARLLEANDIDGNGVPDRNVGYVLDRLLESDARDDALEYITEDQRSMRVIYTVEADATQAEVTEDARELAADFRLDTTPTGDIVVFHETSKVILNSSLFSLALALVFTLVFLMLIYHVLEGRASLGIANMFPIVVTVAVLAGTMPILDLPLNALTGTVLSLTIGVGVAYSVHVTHRFIDEYNECGDAYESLLTTLRGTGGALTGSMLTTLGGSASLILAITPLLGQFGLLMSISVIYSFLMAVVVLPPTLVVWERVVG
ncbi:Predicted exporter protein, RND superfamily [Halobiforma haloterrestris]|uniref:Predicted exporter protein, RND superfamily n=1 Tax=Natronobacterium haloterrestre TaxID=148448 RepID=A0A1I1FJ65_NATHA|nr:MMPL family transporter [Halobiforma haloterrestris]SFB97090.1 Predicted exporter protein, RND superfamily [Halobiforma haloterrestris]